jgi:DNA-binding Lrp family transcriptional regulator
LRKNTKTAVLGDATSNAAVRLDEVDLKIVALLVSGRDNKQIASQLEVPLSTVQRRVRRLFENDTVRMKAEPNYKQLGYSKGVVHLYINNVDAMAVCQKLAEISGVLSVSIHIGNSDIVGEIIYKNSTDVLDVIAKCKRIEGVTRVVWSEEVYAMPSVLSDGKILAYFKRQ